jgi:methionyl-tRNA formyltransferase
MRILLLAYQLIGHTGLSYFLEQPDDEVVGLFTHEDARGEEIWWPSVQKLAQEHGVPTFTPDDINAPEWVERIRQLRPDFILSFWYRFLVREPILKIPPGGCLNMHGSLLPKYRGRAPVNWVLAHGERQTGITLHYMVRGADAGDIVAQAVVPIADDDTPVELYGKLAASERDLLEHAWPLLRERRAPRVKQDRSQATYVGRRTPEDGRFSWSWPAVRIHNLVRAVTHPYPGAFTEERLLVGARRELREQGGARKLLVWSTTPLPGRLLPCPLAPGSLVAVGAEGVTVATGEGYLLLRRVQLEGEDELAGAEFALRHGLAEM